MGVTHPRPSQCSGRCSPQAGRRAGRAFLTRSRPGAGLTTPPAGTALAPNRRRHPAVSFQGEICRLEDLEVSADNYEEFSTYGQFVKGEPNWDLTIKRFGSAGAGNQYHHIVTQGGVNADTIPPEQLQNTENIIILPALLQEAVSDEYLKSAPDGSNRTLYEWLQTQPYDVQRRIGLDILRDLHILK